MNEKFYVVKLLTNTQGQDASSISIFEDGEDMSAEESAYVHYHGILQTYHNAPDVLYAVVEIQRENGNTVIKEIVDHRPEPTPEPEPEPKTIVSIEVDGDVYTITYSDGTVEVFEKPEEEPENNSSSSLFEGV